MKIDIDNPIRPVLLEFFADWCMPCKTLSPIIDKIENKVNSLIDVKKINIDKEKNLTAEFYIQSVPTLILLDNNGEIFWRFAGVTTELEIIKQIHSLLFEM
ncbi:MAG: thioredoxin domain-containing protein [Arachidicoccus sp.]|nr:thioredoxin domain-containing protein [Arachidicoccus sp.]